MFLDRCRTPTPPPRSEQQPTKRKESQRSSTPLPCNLAWTSTRSESPIRQSKRPHANIATSHRGSASGSALKSYRGRSPQRSNRSRRFRSRSPSLSGTWVTQRSRSRSSDSQRSICEGNQYDVFEKLSTDQKRGKSKSASSANSSSLSTSSSLSISEQNEYDSFRKGSRDQRSGKRKAPSSTSSTTKSLPTGRCGFTNENRTPGKVANDIFPMSEGSKFV